MICGYCGKEILCIRCDETEYSQAAGDHRFEPEKCDCRKVNRYINKDAMWYIKSIYETILIGISCICFIGFVVGMIFVIISIPMIWNKPISYHPYPWLLGLMSWSIGIGLANMLFMLCFDKRWRDDYKEHIDEFKSDRKKGQKRHGKNSIKKTAV